jgi:hypothetical protein
MPFDPFTVSASLRGAFLRYLEESHPIHHAETTLREQFGAALRAPDRFVREPLVSMIPS